MAVPSQMEIFLGFLRTVDELGVKWVDTRTLNELAGAATRVRDAIKGMPRSKVPVLPTDELPGWAEAMAEGEGAERSFGGVEP